MYRRSILFCCFSLLMLPLSGVSFAEDDPKPITLTVDYGDGAQKRFSGLKWTDSMTIADALDLAAKHPRGIKFQHRGSGATALLLQIDDLKNGADDRYWIYDVNGKQGDRSYALVKLKAGDSVLWRFDRYK